jgi:DNA-binding transcriptional ArsR family regulator
MMDYLDMKKVKNASMILRALKNPLREKIFTIIKERPGITVMELYTKLRIEQSITSQHLGIMRQSGIVRIEREGRMVHYYVDEANMRIITALVEKLAAFYVHAMASLDETARRK